ncbi:MAG: hypothetical protein LBS71_03170 [Puniceicoccales bacterium]|jgi:hypothetical protein|nr:hypothetical protein [Puniceicoccales bacterium]
MKNVSSYLTVTMFMGNFVGICYATYLSPEEFENYNSYGAFPDQNNSAAPLHPPYQQMPTGSYTPQHQHMHQPQNQYTPPHSPYQQMPTGSYTPQHQHMYQPQNQQYITSQAPNPTPQYPLYQRPPRLSNIYSRITPLSVDSLKNTFPDIKIWLGKVNAICEMGSKVCAHHVGQVSDLESSVRNFSGEPNDCPVMILEITNGKVSTPYFFNKLYVMQGWNLNNPYKAGYTSDDRIQNILNGSTPSFAPEIGEWKTLWQNNELLFFVIYNNNLFLLVPINQQDEGLETNSSNWRTSPGMKAGLTAAAAAAIALGANALKNNIFGDSPTTTTTDDSAPQAKKDNSSSGWSWRNPFSRNNNSPATNNDTTNNNNAPQAKKTNDSNGGGWWPFSKNNSSVINNDTTNNNNAPQAKKANNSNGGGWWPFSKNNSSVTNNNASQAKKANNSNGAWWNPLSWNNSSVTNNDTTNNNNAPQAEEGILQNFIAEAKAGIFQNLAEAKEEAKAGISQNFQKIIAEAPQHIEKIQSFLATQTNQAQQSQAQQLQAQQLQAQQLQAQQLQAQQLQLQQLQAQAQQLQAQQSQHPPHSYSYPTNTQQHYPQQSHQSFPNQLQNDQQLRYQQPRSSSYPTNTQQYYPQQSHQSPPVAQSVSFVQSGSAYAPVPPPIDDDSSEVDEESTPSKSEKVKKSKKSNHKNDGDKKEHNKIKDKQGKRKNPRIKKNEMQVPHEQVSEALGNHQPYPPKKMKI